MQGGATSNRENLEHLKTGLAEPGRERRGLFPRQLIN